MGLLHSLALTGTFHNYIEMSLPCWLASSAKKLSSMKRKGREMESPLLGTANRVAGGRAGEMALIQTNTRGSN